MYINVYYIFILYIVLITIIMEGGRANATHSWHISLNSTNNLHLSIQTSRWVCNFRSARKVRACQRCRSIALGQCDAAHANPIGSMYGMYANIWGILMVNVTIYSTHGSYGNCLAPFWTAAALSQPGSENSPVGSDGASVSALIDLVSIVSIEVLTLSMLPPHNVRINVSMGELGSLNQDVGGKAAVAHNTTLW